MNFTLKNVINETFLIRKCLQYKRKDMLVSTVWCRQDEIYCSGGVGRGKEKKE